MPVITGAVGAARRDAAGLVSVELTLTNAGTGHARKVRLTRFTFVTLSGSGTVTYNAALSEALPLAVESMDAGAAAAPLRRYLKVPNTVKRFAIIEAGTWENVMGTRLTFNFAEERAAPR